MASKNILTQYIVLTPTEEKIFNCLILKKSGVTISKISREIGLARTSIYLGVSSLVKKKIISKVDKFKYGISDLSLSRYQSTVVDPQDKINSLLDELTKLGKGDVVYSIESDEEIKELFYNKKGLIEWQKKIAKNGVVLKGVGSNFALNIARSKFDDSLKQEIKNRGGSSRFVEGKLPGSGVLISFKSSVIIFSRVEKTFYRIDNRNLALFFQNVIGIFYESCKYHQLIG
ncbi:MAG: hypothetical protein WCF94_02565 [bacterium]